MSLFVTDRLKSLDWLMTVMPLIMLQKCTVERSSDLIIEPNSVVVSSVVHLSTHAI